MFSAIVDCQLFFPMSQVYMFSNTFKNSKNIKMGLKRHSGYLISNLYYLNNQSKRRIAWHCSVEVIKRNILIYEHRSCSRSWGDGIGRICLGRGGIGIKGMANSKV